MDIKRIQEADLENKKVLLRVDFNVAVEEGKVKESFKIAAAKETLQYLLKKNCKVAMISHLGRPAAVKTLAGKPDGKINPD
ncbi:MAG: phosphoglycerate kinase, partial [Candidatus Moranbacteria bacterium CG23_combo_of_CG06-09_8_20_14_all_39_10]